MPYTWSAEQRTIERARQAALRREQQRAEAVARVVPATLSCAYCHQPLRSGDGRYCDQRCREKHEDLIGRW
jgi:hypothetical protein